MGKDNRRVAAWLIALDNDGNGPTATTALIVGRGDVSLLASAADRQVALWAGRNWDRSKWPVHVHKWARLRDTEKESWLCHAMIHRAVQTLIGRVERRGDVNVQFGVLLGTQWNAFPTSSLARQALLALHSAIVLQKPDSRKIRVALRAKTRDVLAAFEAAGDNQQARDAVSDAIVELFMFHFAQKDDDVFALLLDIHAALGELFDPGKIEARHQVPLSALGSARARMDNATGIATNAWATFRGSRVAQLARDARADEANQAAAAG